MDVFDLFAKISLDTSEYESGLDKAKSGFSSAAKAAAAAMTAATAAVTAFAKASIDTGMQFDSSMSQVAATMGTTVDQIQDLRDFAMEMGATTAFSATQAADALNYMALAGYDAGESMEMLPTVLDLAAAGSIDLASASDMVTDAQSALGLSAEETAEMVDKMAMASSKSNTSVAQLGEAILTVGGTAQMMAGGTTELSTALGILADNGIKGAEGGTHLRNVLLALSAPTDTASEALESLGVEVFNADGSMRPLNESLGDLNAALETMSDAERTNIISTVFNKTDIAAVNALLANTGNRWNELTGYIDDAAGAAGKMADTQLDNLAGDITLMQSAIEGVQIALSDKLTPSLREGVQFFTELIGKAQEFIGNGGLEGIINGINRLIPVAVAATGVFAAFKAGMALQSVIIGFQEAQVAISLLSMEIGTANLAQAALNGTMTIGETIVSLLTGKMTLAALAQAAMAKAQAVLNAVMSANPVLLLVAGVGSLIAILGTYAAVTGSAKDDTKEFTQSLKETSDAYDDLISSMGSKKTDVETLTATLKRLLDLGGKSGAQKNSIKQIVDQLNEAVPELGLAYDDVTDSINMTTEALDTMLGQAAGQEEYNAQVDRLTELYTEQTEIAKRLEEAEAALGAAQEKNAQELPSYFDNAVDYNDALNESGVATSSLANNVMELTSALEANEAEIAELEAAAESYSLQVGESTGNIAVMTATTEGLVAQMTELQASYQESYGAAYDSITAELGLFNELDGTAKTSIDNLIGILEGQVDYMDTYAANIQKAMELGIDEGLLAKLSDGSQESAQYLDAIVKDGGEHMASLNEQFAKVEEGKQNFSDTVAAMETDFDEKMAEIVEDLSNAFDEMDLHDEAVEIAEYNIQGLIDGTSNPALRQALVDEYTAMANEALEAYKRAVGQHSPSKEFSKAGSYDIQGLIEGAESEIPNLAAVYEFAAETALSSYVDTAESIINELKSRFDEVSNFFTAKSDVSDLEYQLWERTEGKNSSDIEKYAKKLQMLSVQQENQESVVGAAAAAYAAVVEQYGAASEESYNYQKTLLQEKLALQDLLDQIEKLNAARAQAQSEAFMQEAQVRWENSGLGIASATAINAGYTTPHEVAQIANINLVTPDGKVLAEYTAPHLVDYMDANGTPIVNPKR